MLTDDPQTEYRLNSADKSASLAIGIDPDKDKNGVALWCRRRQILLLVDRMTTPETIEFCLKHKEQAFVYLEAGHNINYVWGLHPSWSQQKTASVSRDKGVNNGVGLQIKQFLEHHMIAFAEVMPEKKKWDRQTFTQATGLQTNDQELIDAARLVIGR